MPADPASGVVYLTVADAVRVRAPSNVRTINWSMVRLVIVLISFSFSRTGRALRKTLANVLLENSLTFTTIWLRTIYEHTK
jgi:hypothetical protein